jgi:hypothetical protein
MFTGAAKSISSSTALQREKQKAKAQDRLKNKPVHHIRPEERRRENP